MILNSLNAAFTAEACVAAIEAHIVVGIMMIHELRCTTCRGFPPSSISPTEIDTTAKTKPRIEVKSIFCSLSVGVVAYTKIAILLAKSMPKTGRKKRDDFLVGDKKLGFLWD